MSEPQETTALATRQDMAIVTQAVSPEAMVAQVHLIQEVMGKVMKDGEHYGIIPGTNKPSLLKPGAEKLSMTFRLRPEFRIDRSDMERSHREYEIVCTLYDPSGASQGQGVGSCTTMESRYRWRKAEQACPECGKPTIIRGKKEYGGGWLCFAKKGGCGAKFPDGDPQIENQNMGRVENEDIADVYNTVLKMAKKRAFVDAILTATAASDIFTQDTEDMAANETQAAPGAGSSARPAPRRPMAGRLRPVEGSPRRCGLSGRPRGAIHPGRRRGRPHRGPGAGAHRRPQGSPRHRAAGTEERRRHPSQRGIGRFSRLRAHTGPGARRAAPASLPDPLQRLQGAPRRRRLQGHPGAVHGRTAMGSPAPYPRTTGAWPWRRCRPTPRDWPWRGRRSRAPGRLPRRSRCGRRRCWRVSRGWRPPCSAMRGRR
jgi:ssDNA-binding Zn-finger/Zn-ribbon topoisomerase 1